MTRLLAGIAVAGLVAGCMAQPANGPNSATTPENANASADTVSETAAEPGMKHARHESAMNFSSIRLSRSACFGKCPVYSVTVHADGRVEYNGERWVVVKGKQQGRADPPGLAALDETLGERRLPLAVDYRPGREACGKPVTTDLAGATITVEKGDSRRTLYYYGGCPNVPDWLVELADQIDRAAGSHRWTGKPQGSVTRMSNTKN